MTAPIVVVSIGGAILLAVIWWPTPRLNFSSPLPGAGVLPKARRLRAKTAVPFLVSAVGLGLGTVFVGLLVGVAVAALILVCGWAVATQLQSRRTVQEASELSQLAGTLANQALVAPTVVDAVFKAAPLVTGRIGAAAREMVDECESGGLVEAASNFAATVGRPIAEMMSTVLTEAFYSGSQWVHLAEVLADEAEEAADTARHFHRYVAALMPQVVATVVMAMGIVAITSFTSGDVAQWMSTTVGQQFLLLLAIVTAALCARVLAPAWRAAQ